MSAEEKLKLWEDYSKNRTPELRERIIIEYAGLVKIVAGKLSIYLGYNVEYDDLVGYGTFGLIDAIDKFDYDKGVKFETYASLRIRGAILDQIRKMDWLPRTVRQKQKRMDAAYNKIEAETGRMATEEEVAKERFNRLIAAVKEEANAVTTGLEGTVQKVLVEEVNEQDSKLLTGRLSNNLLVHFPSGRNLIGTIVEVKLTECKGFYYLGELV